MLTWEVFWHSCLVGAGPDPWSKKQCLAALIAAVGGVDQSLPQDTPLLRINTITITPVWLKMLPLPGITKSNLPPCKSSHLQSVNKSQPAAFCAVYHKNGGGEGEGERLRLCLVKGGYILAEDQNCACGAVPLQCPACKERWSGTEESSGKLSVYTIVENSFCTLKQKMNLAVMASAFKSRGIMGWFHIKNKRWSEEEDRYLPTGGGILGVAGSACEDSSAKNTQRFLLSSQGSAVEGFLKCHTSPLSGRRFLKGTAEV